MLITELHSSKLGSTRTFCSIFFSLKDFVANLSNKAVFGRQKFTRVVSAGRESKKSKGQFYAYLILGITFFFRKNTLKNGIVSRVQNLSIAARYDQKFASGVPLPVAEPQKPKLKSGSKIWPGG